MFLVRFGQRHNATRAMKILTQFLQFSNLDNRATQSSFLRTKSSIFSKFVVILRLPDPRKRGCPRSADFAMVPGGLFTPRTTQREYTVFSRPKNSSDPREVIDFSSWFGCFMRPPSKPTASTAACECSSWMRYSELRFHAKQSDQST